MGLVSATDKDGDDLTFSITGGSGENTFSIDNDGNLTVSDNTELDYEVNTSLTLTVVVSDGLDSDVATITININDVVEIGNTAPVSMDIRVTTDENTSTDITVWATNAADDAVTYRLVPVTTNATATSSRTTAAYTPTI